MFFFLVLVCVCDFNSQMPDNGSEQQLEWEYKLSTAGGKLRTIPFSQKKNLQKLISDMNETHTVSKTEEIQHLGKKERH